VTEKLGTVKVNRNDFAKETSVGEEKRRVF